MIREYFNSLIQIPKEISDLAPLHTLRPCLVDGKPATFHRWIDEDKAVLKVNPFTRPGTYQEILRSFREEDMVCASEATIEKLRTCFALVIQGHTS